MAASMTVMRAAAAQVVAAKPSSSFVSKAVRPAFVNRARSVTVYAADRPTWYPGAKPAPTLDGKSAGDRGFDPLRLANKQNFAWLKEGELTNGRWAMLAVAHILFTEAFGIGQPWWTAGAQVDLPLPLTTLIAIEVALFAVLEGKRYQHWKKTSGDEPLFDPMGMKSNDTAEKEVKNGRLAMLAFLGFSSQAAVWGKGPIESLKFHLADPGHNNIFASPVGGEFLVAIGALSFLPFILEARRSFKGEDEDDFRPIPFL
jgi:hypothetical protein